MGIERPFESPGFRQLWCSSLAAAGAQWMERVATGWLALETGGGPLSVGIVFAARSMPSLLFGLAAGALADRFERRRLLLVVALLASLLAVTLGLLVGEGSVVLWQVASIAFLNGCVQVTDPPARQALVFDTVGRAAAPNAIALNAVASRLMGAVGAFAGGLVIPTLGITNCYFLVAVGYLLGGVLAAMTPVKAVDHSVRARPTFVRSLAGAARLIVERPIVRTLVVAAMACEVFGFSYMTAVPGFARDVLRAGAEGLGTLTAASSVGATVAVVLLAGLPSMTRREPLLAAVYALYGVAILAFSAAPTLLVAAGIMVVIGGCASAFDALEQMMIQLAVPDDQRGRAVGIWVFSIGTAPVGHLEVGALAALVGAPTALLVNGACVVAGALVLIGRAPTYRPRRSGAPLYP
jgi:MFS transporter, DHA1 family, staphyloferrin A biosynthesis exporter